MRGARRTPVSKAQASLWGGTAEHRETQEQMVCPQGKGQGPTRNSAAQVAWLGRLWASLGQPPRLPSEHCTSDG